MTATDVAAKRESRYGRNISGTMLADNVIVNARRRRPRSSVRVTVRAVKRPTTCVRVTGADPTARYAYRQWLARNDSIDASTLL